jgi:hypothetical protein
LSLLVASAPARAVPPLVQAVEVADRGLSAWWRERELVVGRLDDPERPAVRPLVSAAETTLPASLLGWTRIGEVCAAVPTATGAWGDVPLEVRADASGSLPVVSVRSHDRLVAQTALAKPVSVCALVLGEADALPGPEVIVAWRMGDVHGFTVFHVPEAVR